MLEKYLEGVTKEQFDDSDEKHDLVVRRLEVIGEAARHIPEDFKNHYADIPWRDIGDMRNVLIHEYFDVDYDIVWKTATQFIPPLKKQIQSIITNISKEKE